MLLQNVSAVQNLADVKHAVVENLADVEHTNVNYFNGFPLFFCLRKRTKTKQHARFDAHNYGRQRHNATHRNPKKRGRNA